MKFRLLLSLLLVPGFLSAQPEGLPVFTVESGQVYQASVTLETDGGSSLNLALRSDKRKEFADFTEQHLHQKIRLIVSGETVAEPIINEPILGGSLALPCSSPEAGLVLARKIMAR